MIVHTAASRSGDRHGVGSVRRLVLALLATVLALTVQQALDPQPAAAEPFTATSPVVEEVAAADAHTCLLKPGGDVGCWGWGSEAPPRGAGPFTSISAAGSRTCGVKQDGSVLCWGAGSVQSLAGEFVSVSTGSDTFACALEVGEGVTCWQGSGSGATPTRHDGQFAAVDAGNGHACAITSAGSIECWGANSVGQAPAQVPGSFLRVSASTASTCAIDSAGDLSCWGDDSEGQAPRNAAGPFTEVSSAVHGTCAVRSSGSVVCWGQVLDGGSAPSETTGPFQTVSVGEFHACGVRRTDSLVSCWGHGDLMPKVPGPLEPDPLVEATETSPYRHGYTAWSSSPVTASVEGTLPPGLTLTVRSSTLDMADLVLAGTPRKRGTYHFTIIATNLFGTSKLPVTLRVLPPPGFDVNADGIPDLAVGAPGENVGKKVDAGQVTVLLGSADGAYGRKGAVTITQETVGQRSERGDRFGAAIATGEITGDNYVDLIIGTPGEDRSAGQVVVVHGSAKGLTGSKRTVLRQGSGGAAGAAEAGDGFGSAISIGDGLWIGAPGENLGRAADAGVVTRFPTTPQLRTTGSVQHQQGARGVPGAPESGDRFGASLAGGGKVIGSPGEDVGKVVDAGSLTWELTNAVSQGSPGVPGELESGDHFGAAAAVTTVWDYHVENGGWLSFDVIVIGVPGEDLASKKDAGTVIVGFDAALQQDALEVAQEIAQNSAGPTDKPESGDRFGTSIALTAAGNRMIVGAPGEDVNGKKDAGAVGVFSVSTSCGWPCRAWIEDGAGKTLNQDSGGVPGAVRAGSQFGATLSLRPGTSGGYVVGAPGTRVSGRAGAGAVVVMPTRGTAQEVHQNSPGVPGSAEKGDRFGIVTAP
jgi:hypothetical protein